MTRKDKHRLLAKLAGIPWEFHCPQCSSHYFGSSGSVSGRFHRYCRDQFNTRCGWDGPDEECRLTPDYDKDHNAWVAIRLALDGKCLWSNFIAHWQSQGVFPWDYMKPSEVYGFLNDLPGQVDAAIEVMKG